MLGTQLVGRISVDLLSRGPLSMISHRSLGAVLICIHVIDRSAHASGPNLPVTMKAS